MKNRMFTFCKKCFAWKKLKSNCFFKNNKCHFVCYCQRDFLWVFYKKKSIKRKILGTRTKYHEERHKAAQRTAHFTVDFDKINSPPSYFSRLCIIFFEKNRNLKKGPLSKSHRKFDCTFGFRCLQICSELLVRRISHLQKSCIKSYGVLKLARYFDPSTTSRGVDSIWVNPLTAGLFFRGATYLPRLFLHPWPICQIAILTSFSEKYKKFQPKTLILSWTL